MRLTRRRLLQATAAALLVPARARAVEDALADLEARHGGRLGVFGLAADGEVLLAHRADERFALCSTLKALVTGCVLAEADAGRLRLDETVRMRRRDLVEHAPVTGGLVGERVTLDALCHATMTTSDNPAVNLLLDRLGGYDLVHAFLRGLGDDVTRLVRREPDVNVVDLAHGDTRDTSTPRAMATGVRALALGDALTTASRDRYVGWLRDTRTGLTRLRATWPDAWRPGDKTGTGDDATNDVAVAWPPGRAPFVLAAYVDRVGTSPEDDAAVLAEVGRIVASTHV